MTELRLSQLLHAGWAVSISTCEVGYVGVAIRPRPGHPSDVVDAEANTITGLVRLLVEKVEKQEGAKGGK